MEKNNWYCLNIFFWQVAELFLNDNKSKDFIIVYEIG